RAAERALKYGISIAHGSSEGAYADGGAIVALDPRNGDVLAMASNPTYKPSLFSGRKDMKKLAPLLNPKVAQEDNFPAFNRAIQVGYPPGSTFKPVTAIAAMQAHVVGPLTPLLCSPSYT